jgi:enamine deaminase RidA (YjgF/YER057c/UK114 family)
MNDAVPPSVADKLCFAGISPRDQQGGIAEQTRNALEQLDARRAQAGTDRSALLTVHIWLRDMALFQEMTAVWNDWIGSEAPPSRSCVSGGSLNPDALVEIVATAAAPAQPQSNHAIERYGLVRGEGRPTMCLGLAYRDWFAVCTLASDYSADIAGQTQQILRVFDTFLEESGTDKSNILTMDIWLKRLSDKAVVDATLADWLAADHLPGGSCVRADMARPEMLIEIRITASR